MEEAKRRGALYQSSAGSLWCCLWLRSSQGRAQVQSRELHTEQLPGFVFGVCLLSSGWAWVGWDTAHTAGSWFRRFGLWDVLGISSVLLRPWSNAHTPIPWLQWANRSSPERLHSLLLPSTLPLQCWHTMASRSDRLHSILSGKSQ